MADEAIFHFHSMKTWRGWRVRMRHRWRGITLRWTMSEARFNRRFAILPHAPGRELWKPCEKRERPR